MSPLALIALLLVPSPGVEVEGRIVKAIKEAERGAFEQHRAPAYFAVFTPDAVWVRGRSGTPDRHDVTFSRATKEAFMRLELAEPPNRDKRLFFEEPAFDFEADPPTLELRIGRHFFGGTDVIAVRYTLRLVGKTWKVSAVRTWPVEERVADQHLLFNEAFWAHADELADTPGTPTPEELLENLRWARRFPEAYQIAVRITGAPDAPAQHWMLRAEAALRAGQLDDALASVKRALAIDPTLIPPPVLRGRPKK